VPNPQPPRQHGQTRPPAGTHCLAHQAVLALPSTAFDAGESAAAELALLLCLVEDVNETYIDHNH
jgi:hypothetical protein